MGTVAVLFSALLAMLVADPPSRNVVRSESAERFGSTCHGPGDEDQFFTAAKNSRATWTWYDHKTVKRGLLHKRRRGEIPTPAAFEHTISICNEDANTVSVAISAHGKTREYEVQPSSRLVFTGSYAVKTEVKATWSARPRLLSSDMIHLGHYAR